MIALMETLLLLFFLWLAPANSYLQAQTGQSKESSEQQQGDPPSAVLNKFMELAAAKNFDTAASFLDPKLSRSQRRETAEKLYTLLHQRGWIDLGKLSDKVEGDLYDHQDPQLEVVGSIRINNHAEDVLLKRAQVNGQASWQFPLEFLKKISSLYADYTASKEQSWKKWVPRWSQDLVLFGLEAWQWVAMVAALLLAYLLAVLMSQIIFKTLTRLLRRRQFIFISSFLQNAYQPVKYILLVGLFHLQIWIADISYFIRSRLYAGEIFIIIVALTLLAIKASHAIIQHLRHSLERSHRTNALAMLPPAEKGLKILIITIAISYFLKEMGVNITAILAGLGIGGIAIALASQKTIENLIGGIAIIVDQPVRVGDFCRFGEKKLGTVIDVGLRSTRIRTLERTVIAIPNAEFAQTQLENFGKRDMIGFFQTVGVRYETTPNQLRYLLVQFKELLLAHPMVDKEPARVRFVNFGTHALEIEFYAYIKTNDYDVFLATKEDLNLRIMEILAACGTSLAFSSHTVYWESSPGLNNEKAKVAANAFTKLQSSNSPPLPFYPSEKAAQIKDSLTFPKDKPT